MGVGERRPDLFGFHVFIFFPVFISDAFKSDKSHTLEGLGDKQWSTAPTLLGGSIVFKES